MPVSIYHAIYTAIFLQFIRKLLKKTRLIPDTKFMPDVYDYLPDNFVAMTIFNPASVNYQGQICAAVFHCTALDGITNGRIADAVQKIFNKACVGFITVSEVRSNHLRTLGALDNPDEILPDLTTTPRPQWETIQLLNKAIGAAIGHFNFEIV